MTAHLAPANRTAGLSGSAPDPSAEVVSVELDALLAGRVPAGDDIVVVVHHPNPPTALVEPHRHADNLIVVAAAPADLAVGQVGALAGLGRPWSVVAGRLRQAIADGAGSEAEVRWRLWNDGAFVVAARAADDDPGPGRLPPEVADRVPDPRVRPPSRRAATVPTISWVVHGHGDLDACLAGLDDGPLVPDEVLVVGDGPVEGRLRFVPDVDSAVEVARGAVVWFTHRQARPAKATLARMWRRLVDERVEVARVAYRTDHGTLRGAAGLDAVDAAADAPVVAAVRRRALRKHLGGIGSTWPATVALERVAVVVADPVEVPFPTPDAPRRPRPSDLAALDMRELVTVARRQRPGDADGATSEPSVTRVGYVGFPGYGNFGDDLVLAATRHLLGGIEVDPNADHGHGVVLGGGTLLNARGYYLRIAERITVPGVPRVVLGTGVVSPDLAGWTEDLDAWRWFLDGSVGVGLRGPHSLDHLRAWGYEGPAEVVGDTALALPIPRTHDQGRVVVAPVGASSVGDVSADDERAQTDLLVEAVGRWRSEGRPVTLLSAHAGDDRVIVDLLRRLGSTDVDHVPAHRDLDAGLAAIGAAELVVGTRLHALVAAAAAGVPFVGLAYLPKVADFAASVDMSDAVRPVGAWTVDDLLGHASPERGHLTARVTDLRGRLESLAARFASSIAGDLPA